MDELLNMDSESLKAQMAEAMDMLTSTDMKQNILDQKEDVLALMEAQVRLSVFHSKIHQLDMSSDTIFICRARQRPRK